MEVVNGEPFQTAASASLADGANGRNTEDPEGARLWISDNAIDLFTVQISGPFSPSYPRVVIRTTHMLSLNNLITSLKLDT